MMFVDTHCHILSEYYENIDEVVENAISNGVGKFINAAYNYGSSLEVISLVDKYDGMYGVVGLHPSNCNEDFVFDIFDNLDKKIVGIGEIGLDYHYGKGDRDRQIEIFRRQLSIAEKLKLPVVVHSRDATMDTINILKEYKVRGVIHSFSGSLEVAMEYIKMGFVLGVNGVITFKNCHLSLVIAKVGLENIILETDCPYLTPVPYRGSKNEPAKMIETAKFVADLYGISLVELAKFTNLNVRRIFDI